MMSIFGGGGIALSSGTRKISIALAKLKEPVELLIKEETMREAPIAEINSLEKVRDVYREWLDSTNLADRPSFALSGPALLSVKKGFTDSFENFIGEERFVLYDVCISTDSTGLIFSFVSENDAQNITLFSDLTSVREIIIPESVAIRELTGFNRFFNTLWDKHDAKLKRQIKKEAKKLEKLAKEKELEKTKIDPIFGSW